MKNFGKPGGFGGGRGGGGFRGGGRPGFGERKELFDTTCSNCGNACQVPFRPNGSKPVYCKDCFVRPEEGQRSYDRPRRDDRPSFAPQPAKAQPDPRIDALKRDIESLTAKVDSLIEMYRKDSLHTTIVKATAPKPVKVVAKKKAKK